MCSGRGNRLQLMALFRGGGDDMEDKTSASEAVDGWMSVTELVNFLRTEYEDVGMVGGMVGGMVVW